MTDEPTAETAPRHVETRAILGGRRGDGTSLAPVLWPTSTVALSASSSESVSVAWAARAASGSSATTRGPLSSSQSKKAGSLMRPYLTISA